MDKTQKQIKYYIRRHKEIACLLEHFFEPECGLNQIELNNLRELFENHMVYVLKLPNLDMNIYYGWEADTTLLFDAIDIIRMLDILILDKWFWESYGHKYPPVKKTYIKFRDYELSKT